MFVFLIVNASNIKLVILLQLTVLTVYIFLYGKMYLVRWYPFNFSFFPPFCMTCKPVPVRLMFFFLEPARELRLILIREETAIQNSGVNPPPPTPYTHQP
jgi:hypothetical protein